MAAKDPLRERMLRNLERAMEHPNADFERIEFWAAALDAFAQPVPTYAAPREFLLAPNGERADGTRGPESDA